MAHRYGSEVKLSDLFDRRRPGGRVPNARQLSSSGTAGHAYRVRRDCVLKSEKTSG